MSARYLEEELSEGVVWEGRLVESIFIFIYQTKQNRLLSEKERNLGKMKKRKKKMNSGSVNLPKNV